MLSTAAWNAFLKTLEEPPPNTVFVLATTEAQKVPATVVDRCHRFDFHRPTVEQIASVVRRAAQAEAIEIPPEAVAAVARSATGSFRDALGTLEQLVTYSGSEIALEDVLAVLGVADAGLLEETRRCRRCRGRPPGVDRAGALRGGRSRRGLVRRGPGGARARAAGRADAGRAARRTGVDRGGRRTLARPGRARGQSGRRAFARAVGRGAGGRARRRGPAYQAGAGTGEGGAARDRRLDDRVACPDRALGARARRRECRRRRSGCAHR